MNDKLKKVLKILGIGAIGFIIGVGSLIGVSSCANKNNGPRGNEPRQAIAHRETITYSEKKSIKIREDFVYEVDYDDPNQFWIMPCEVTLLNGFIGASLDFTSDSVGGIQSIVCGDEYTIWSKTGGRTQYADYLEIRFELPIDEFNYNFYFLHCFEYIENPFQYEYTFNNQINYYGPYDQTIYSDFVVDSTMQESYSMTSKFLLRDTLFKSGGQIFDTIKLEYYNAIAYSYLDSNGNIQTWTNDGYATYSYMYYINSVSNTYVLVNQRDRVSYESNGGYGYYQIKSSSWISSNYRNIKLLDAPSEQMTTELGVLNNLTDNYSVIVQNTDVGLANVFTLLTTAFSSIIPLLSIQIIPGITIGLLIFMPLIVGIILLVIWLVKR